MQDVTKSDLIGVRTIARRLGVTTQSVRNYEERGLIPTAQRVIDTNTRVWPADLLERLDHIEKRTPAGPSCPAPE